MADENDQPKTPPNIQEPPQAPPTGAPPVTPPADDEVATRISAIEESVSGVTDLVAEMAKKFDAALSAQTPPPTTPDDPPTNPEANPEVLKLQGELEVLKTAFEQEAAAKLAKVNARKSALIDEIVQNNPVYNAQKDTLIDMDESFLAMLKEQSKPAEPRVREAGGNKYSGEDFETQAARLREQRRNNRKR